MSLTFGDITFDWVDYWREAGSLALAVADGPPTAEKIARRVSSDEGWPLRFDEDGNLIFVELWSARGQLEKFGELTITLPDGTVLRSPDAADYIREQEAQAAA